MDHFPLRQTMMHKGAQKPGWPSADDGVFLGNRITHLRLRESAPLQSFLGLPFGRDFNGLFHFGKPFIKLKQSPSARPVCWMLNVGDVRPLTTYQNGEAANEVVCSSLTVVGDMPLHLPGVLSTCTRPNFSCSDKDLRHGSIPFSSMVFLRFFPRWEGNVI